MKRFLAVRPLFAILPMIVLFSGVSSAETRVESIIGTEFKVDTLTQSFIRKTPRDEQVCSLQDVPVYGQGKQGDEIGSMIIGGLIGSAVGNKLSDSNGGGAAGAVAGALLGRQAAKKNTQQGQIVGYRQQETCQTNRVIYEEEVNKVIGYRVRVEADGQMITLEKNSPASVGDRIEIRKQVTYSTR